MLAGIWEESEYKGRRRTAFAILTYKPNELIAAYAPACRSPSLKTRVDSWLDLSQPATLDEGLLLPLDGFEVGPMNRAMNSPRQKDIALIDPTMAA